MKPMKFDGKYNDSKLGIFVALYCCVRSNLYPDGLTIKSLSRYSHVSLRYLYYVLPIYCQERPYPLTGKVWDKRFVVRLPGVAGGRLIWVWKLSRHGVNTVHKVPAHKLKAKIIELGLEELALKSGLIKYCRNATIPLDK